MKIEKIGVGSTIEEAFENAKAELNAPETAQLNQEVVQYPKKKLFGLKTDPAKVLVWYEKEDPKPVKTPAAKPDKAPEKTKQPQKKQDKPEKPAQQKTESAKKAEPQKQNEKKNAPAADKKKNNQPDAAKQEAPAAQEAPEEKRIPVEIKENDTAANYLKMIVSGMGIETCEITLEKIEGTEEYVYTLSCGDADGALIGRRGETLDAIQYLVRLTENKGLDEEKHRKISVNIGDYREKRNSNLRSLAQRQARQVLKYGRNIALDPMSPYERRIIHTTIQGINGVTSHSVGSDSNRKVIISLEEGVTPTHPSRGGYNNRGSRRQGGGGRGGRGGYQKKEAYSPAVTREPRKDSEGSLYGKIEIPKKDAE